MYLTDRELAARLADFQFATDGLVQPFDPEVQIGPCSIDLRLSGVYWTPKRRRRREVLDLERTRLAELNPRRGWRRHEIGENQKLTVRPGHMVLARIAESFRMPSDCAGAIEGRSSYARLGLSVHAAGGFINPGWRGHMPLTLVNHSPKILRLPVGTPLCQLLVIKLDGAPDRDYEQRADRKYFNDVGGPSYWWRDRLMLEIRRKMSAAQLTEAAFDELDELFAGWDHDEGVLERLENFVAKTPPRTYGNSDDLLDAFAKRERRAQWLARARHFVAQWSWAATLTLLAGALWANTAGWLKVGLAITVLVSVVALAWSFVGEPGSFLTVGSVDDLRRKRDAARPPGAAPANTIANGLVETGGDPPDDRP